MTTKIAKEQGQTVGLQTMMRHLGASTHEEAFEVANLEGWRLYQAKTRVDAEKATELKKKGKSIHFVWERSTVDDSDDLEDSGTSGDTSETSEAEKPSGDLSEVEGDS